MFYFKWYWKGTPLDEYGPYRRMNQAMEEARRVREEYLTEWEDADDIDPDDLHLRIYEGGE